MGSDFTLDFVGIGMASSGTTWLHECLKKHPQLCVPESKELFYFCADPLWGALTNYNNGEKWLRRKFSHCKTGQIKGEISPVYISDPKSPILISKSYPNIKIIVSYRNPTERLYSFYYMLLRLYSLPVIFEDFLERYPKYIESGFYYTLTKRFLDHFPKNNFHFIVYDDICKEPGMVIKSLYNFLGVDEEFVPICLKKRVNERKVARFKIIKNIIGNSTESLKYKSIGNKLHKIFDFLRVHEFARWTAAKNLEEATVPPMKEETKNRLIETYSEENMLFGKLINRDLSNWNK